LKGEKKHSFPQHIREQLERNGYFKLTAKQRLEVHKEILEKARKEPYRPELVSFLRGGDRWW